MTILSDTITKHVQEALSKEGFEPRLIAPRVWEELSEEDRKQCGLQDIIRRMKSTAKALTADAFTVVRSGQIELPFKIDGAVAMDVEGRKIRLTESLSRVEFKRAIEIRRKQIKDDRKALEEWVSADRMATPYWTTHPDWSFGQCVRALSRDMAKKKGKPTGKNTPPEHPPSP